MGLADPVRPQLPALMQKLHRAGVHTIMLTGDQSATARAVAEQIGLSANGRIEIIDLADLDRLAPADIAVAAGRAHAFARISPGQKLGIVRALQDSGAVVAMIGDGINDSPALRAANVGMAIGRDGDAAAREVADVFFASDDLGMLPVAIERGRATYANIRKAIHYILSSNTSEVMLMLAGTGAGGTEMLSPIQLLWINLISDVLPAIGLAMEPPDPDVMEHSPSLCPRTNGAARPIRSARHRSRNSNRRRLRGWAFWRDALRVGLAAGAHDDVWQLGHRPAPTCPDLPLIRAQRLRIRRAPFEPGSVRSLSARRWPRNWRQCCCPACETCLALPRSAYWMPWP